MDAPARDRRRRRWLLGVVALCLVAAGGAGAAWALPQRSASPETASPAPRTAPVVRRDLQTAATVTGTVSYPQTGDVELRATGVVTWLPARGVELAAGDVVARVNDRPVVAIAGVLPMWRDLQTGVEGRDVEQLEQNLAMLSPGGFSIDDDFTEGTAAAVKRWQHDLGLPETGRVGVGDVVVLSATRRVDSLLVRPGAAAPAAALRLSAPRAAVVADVPTATAGWARPSTRVSLQTGRTRTTGVVVSAGPLTSGGTGGSGADSGSSTPMSRITIRPSAAITAAAGTPVSIVRALQTRKQVLAVPVTALVAGAGGGYGVEVRARGGDRLIAVTVGLISAGQAEVSAPSLAAGDQVVIAS